MALIVHLRSDGSIALDRRSTLPESHPFPSSTLEKWGVTPGQPFSIDTDDGPSAIYSFSGFGTKISKGEEVADHRVLVYERQAE